MAEAMDAQQVMSGTEGEVWIDGKYMAQVTAFKAVVNLEKVEVNQVKVRGKKYKTTGWEGKGNVKLNHMSSFCIQATVMGFITLVAAIKKQGFLKSSLTSSE